MFSFVNPNFIMPARRTLRELLLDRDEEHFGPGTETSSIEPFSLTCDAWTSDSADHYIAVTKHFIDESWVLRSICLGMAASETKQTATQIIAAHELEDLLIAAGCAHGLVVCVTHDNGANFVAGVREFMARRQVTPSHPSVDETVQRCFAHSLQLAVLHALEGTKSKSFPGLHDVEDIEKLLNSMHMLVAHFKKTIAQELTSALRQQLASLALLQPQLLSARRW